MITSYKGWGSENSSSVPCFEATEDKHILGGRAREGERLLYWLAAWLRTILVISRSFSLLIGQKQEKHYLLCKIVVLNHVIALRTWHIAYLLIIHFSSHSFHFSHSGALQSRLTITICNLVYPQLMTVGLLHIWSLDQIYAVVWFIIKIKCFHCEIHCQLV